MIVCGVIVSDFIGSAAILVGFGKRYLVWYESHVQGQASANKVSVRVKLYKELNTECLGKSQVASLEARREESDQTPLRRRERGNLRE